MKRKAIRATSSSKSDYLVSDSHLLVHALAEVHVLRQTLAAVFQVDTQEHLVCKVLLGLTETCIQLTTQTHQAQL